MEICFEIRFFFLLVRRKKVRASPMVDKCSGTELHHSPKTK